VRERIEQCRANLDMAIQGDLINGLDHIEPDWGWDNWFRTDCIEWVPPEARPDKSRFWADAALLSLQRGMLEREVLLVHIGIGGLAAFTYAFSNPTISRWQESLEPRSELKALLRDFVRLSSCLDQ
jgi:hypothetical protein